ncbi:MULTISPECIES: hypothetical protein [Myxococcus]|uniref:Lipoprotein n=1 Tax=Myxococcus xanthus TaxID=34 RepID=A0AAE6FY13_MYXXA|nr:MULTISPECIES: hypothetical protein [Myxococcus]QDE67460.1 hypothetical protein BHS09_10945 [Myxococcus xanthus]QDE74736.1 hypothetical protein BHS08_10960 [Myxococcus xanthus]QDE96324.1 hypothetical protein BHS05_10980 [Myxococcus xanthus]WAM28755.1 hypothetical protein OZ403_11820 [Myxococcus sp. NMCA1]
MKLHNVLLGVVAAGLMMGCGGAAPEDMPETEAQESALSTCGYVQGPESYVSSEEACEMALHFAPQFCSGLGGVRSITNRCLITDGPPYLGSYRVCCNQ